MSKVRRLVSSLSVALMTNMVRAGKKGVGEEGRRKEMGGPAIYRAMISRAIDAPSASE